MSLLAEAREVRKAHARVDSDQLERDAERIAVSDIRGLVRGGQLLPIEEIPDELAPAIASIEVVTRRVGSGEIEYVSKVRLWNKNDAIRTLFQFRGDGKVNDKNVNVKDETAAKARYDDAKNLALRTPPHVLEEVIKGMDALIAKMGPQ